MNWLKRVFQKVLGVVPGAFKAATEWVFDHATGIMPIVEVCMDIGTAVTPPTWDEAIWNAFKTKYPAFFNQTLKTPEEYKLYALAAATELIAARFPWLGTSFARLMAQWAYTLKAKKYDAPALPAAA
ncbi:MAG TPA: hypothetical protein PKJ41_03805 [Bryobacteraceae bacterium]|nr:hypothetical protein [Bryobacteraceae bacterium]HPT26938.1 hypothetical protein [Bryobacteraceae bacterium]